MTRILNLNNELQTQLDFWEDKRILVVDLCTDNKWKEQTENGVGKKSRLLVKITRLRKDLVKSVSKI